MTAVTDREPLSPSVSSDLHLYEDPEPAIKQPDETRRKVLELVELKNETGQPPLDADLERWRKFGRFPTEGRNPADEENCWAVNYDALREATEFNDLQATETACCGKIFLYRIAPCACPCCRRPSASVPRTPH